MKSPIQSQLIRNLSAALLLMALLIPLLAGCRPIIKTTYVQELTRGSEIKTDTLPDSLDRYRIFRVDEYNNGRMKWTPLVDVNP